MIRKWETFFSTNDWFVNQMGEFEKSTQTSIQGQLLDVVGVLWKTNRRSPPSWIKPTQPRQACSSHHQIVLNQFTNTATATKPNSVKYFLDRLLCLELQTSGDRIFQLIRMEWVFFLSNDDKPNKGSLNEDGSKAGWKSGRSGGRSGWLMTIRIHVKHVTHPPSMSPISNIQTLL